MLRVESQNQLLTHREHASRCALRRLTDALATHRVDGTAADAAVLCSGFLDRCGAPPATAGPHRCAALLAPLVDALTSHGASVRRCRCVLSTSRPTRSHRQRAFFSPARLCTGCEHCGQHRRPNWRRSGAWCASCVHLSRQHNVAKMSHPPKRTVTPEQDGNIRDDLRAGRLAKPPKCGVGSRPCGRRGGGRNRARTYDLYDVTVALVPTELCARATRRRRVCLRESTSHRDGPRRDRSDGGSTRPPHAPLGGTQVGVGHLDAENALALMADHVKRLRPANRPCHSLAVSAALTRDDGPHVFSRVDCAPPAMRGCRPTLAPCEPSGGEMTEPRPRRCSLATPVSPRAQPRRPGSPPGARTPTG